MSYAIYYTHQPKEDRDKYGATWIRHGVGTTWITSYKFARQLWTTHGGITSVVVTGDGKPPHKSEELIFIPEDAHEWPG